MRSCTRTTVLLVIVTLFLTLTTVGATANQHQRHLLHHPFYPVETAPPAKPPISSVPPHRRRPKQPFSATPSTPRKPFFQTIRSSPPPPAPTAVTTFPANISSVIFPHHRHPPKPVSRKLVVTAVSVSLASAALVAAVAALVLYHRHIRHFPVPYKSSRSDSIRLYPPDAVNSSSEFLYLETVLNSRGEIDVESIPNSSNVDASAYRRLDSPELMPLPPLPRNVLKRSNGNGEGGHSSDEEFFSPRASLGEKGSPSRTGSSSRRLFQGLGTDNYGSTSFNSRTPSYPCSKSGSRPDSISSSPSQPLNPSPRSQISNSPGSVVDYPAPSRPPPPPHFISQGRNSGSHQFVRVKLPPPPPPLPPARFWETPVASGTVKETIWGPPDLVAPSRPVMLQNLAPIEAQNNVAMEKNVETPKAKLKPLHWDKVRASSDRAMVWDQIKSTSFQLNEEMIETLFTVNTRNLNPKEHVRRQVFPTTQPENRVLDLKKSQNIAILLRALNVTTDEVCEALLEGNVDTVGTELLESLLKMAPTKEEESKLKEFKDEALFKLGPAEKFLKALLDIPFAFTRVEAMLYITNFDSEVEYLLRSLETLEAACEELRKSKMFLKLLEAVLQTGNRMNVGTNRGDAHAFKLDTLLKLVDVKGADGKTTLLHFVVQEIIRAEGSHLLSAKSVPMAEQSPLQDVEFRKLGLQVVAGLSGELTSVKKAASMDSVVLSSEVLKLVGGISKIEEVVELNQGMVLKESSHRFAESMNGFLRRAREEIAKIQVQESVAFSLVKEITEYFHGNSTEEEAHPFRIFMVVRDFLSILDKVCKEVGKVNERTIVGAGRQFQAPAYPTMVPVFPGLSGRQQDDET